ncbi:MAG: ATP-dependent DNA helicase RecG [Pseudomonadota bacterium]
MSQRPEILFPLFAALTTLDGIGPKTRDALAKIGIEKPRDLLFHLPTSVVDRRPRATVNGVELPAVVTVPVTVRDHIPGSGQRPYRVMVEDAETTFTLIFFRAKAAWLEARLPPGSRRIVSGRLELFEHSAQMAHPDHMVPEDAAATIPAFEPIYPATAGVTQRTLARAVADALGRLPSLDEWARGDLLESTGWPGWATAIARAHAPDGTASFAAGDPARARLAYDELFAHQLTLAIARAGRRKRAGRASPGTGAIRNRVLASLPYRPTGAQLRAIEEIGTDMGGPHRMNRLLQGDVGSGKTLVAFLALVTAVEAGGQGVMMAPTEILARQHLYALRPLADDAGVTLDILTGRDKGRERAAKLRALAAGQIQVLVGTHAVFQDDVAFADLRLAVIDEQHRFGVRERLRLGEKGAAADTLVMTATPIPRSLELANYGDMEVSVLDEKPPGRKPIETVLVSQTRVEAVIERLRAAVVAGRQAYWVCPLVGTSEQRDWTAAEDRARSLRLALGEDRVGLVHGQMPSVEKDAAMAQFEAGEVGVLVATTVIEVGVNVPNATIMVIEQAETFGLAQLHQLRGRVGRGDAASSCLMLYGSLTDSAEKRLKVLRDTEDGFCIAEEDLKLRGAGDVLGVAQSGLPRFRVADMERQADLMRRAQDDARLLLYEDPMLEQPRGKAARVLLWLLEQDRALRLLSVG